MQPPVERILCERVEEHANVIVDLGAELIELSYQEDSVLLTTRDEAGRLAAIKARYVIACDGASSTVRQLVNISLENLGFDEPWLVLDLIVKDAALAKLPNTSSQYCEPARPYTYIVGPGNIVDGKSC
jgi:3-(3-hydroxy-phenyl)propionate hydroxylase